MENGWTKRIEELEAEVGRLQMMNPCNHTGFESAPCDVCGYPDPRKLIAKLKAENRRLRELVDGATEIVEIANCTSPAQCKWKVEWMQMMTKILEWRGKNEHTRTLEGSRSQSGQSG